MPKKQGDHHHPPHLERRRSARLAVRYSKRKLCLKDTGLAQLDIYYEIKRHVEVLNSRFLKTDSRLRKFQEAAAAISALVNIGDNVEMIVKMEAIPALVRCLDSPWCSESCKHKLETECATALSLIAIFGPDYQQLIVDAGAIGPTVKLLKRQWGLCGCMAASDVISKAADIITNIAYENQMIKTNIRVEGGIPPLVELLKFPDVNVKRAAAAALRSLAHRNDENKNQIVELNALPMLVSMLHSEDSSVHGVTIGAIGNLVESSLDIMKKAIRAGALKPVISLLSSTRMETQREAALLIGQFAASDSYCKAHIAQRGAITPLIRMLESSDEHVLGISASALGCLAQEIHSAAGIGKGGAIVSLLNILNVKTGSLQQSAAFALYGLAKNKENVADFIKAAGVQKLQADNFADKSTKDFVVRTLIRLENKIHGPVLNQLIDLMKTTEKTMQTRIALALAHLCDPKDGKSIFIDNNGLELLLELLYFTGIKQQKYSSSALYKLARKGTSFALKDSAPSSPTQRVFLGEEFVNNPTSSDVTFLIDGKEFYGHKICLAASSDIFRAMFDGPYEESNAQNVKIPNIGWEVFELMMRYMYTGSIDITKHMAQDLLVAADQYLLQGLKRLCEYTISQDIHVDNIRVMYDLADTFNASDLRRACILFSLEHFNMLSSELWFPEFVKHIIPGIRSYLTDILTRPVQSNRTLV